MSQEDVYKTNKSVCGIRDKCCINCGQKEKKCFVVNGLNAWDTEKDYCSKWNEKEDKRTKIEALKEEMYQNEGLHVELDDIEYFQQRVKESLDKLPNTRIKNLERHFDWLGIEWDK